MTRSEALTKTELPPAEDYSFYRNYYHYFLLGLMGIIVLLIIGVGIVFYQAYHRPLPVFFAENPKKQTMQLVSYVEPNLLADTILSWSTKAATAAYSFDFVNYNNQLAAVKPYFTTAGWRGYLLSVNALIDTIIARQMIVNGVVSGTPVISNQGPLPGKGYSWRVQIPFLVTYQTGSSTRTNNYLVVLTIIRVPTIVNPQGIGVDQFVMAQPTR